MPEQENDAITKWSRYIPHIFSAFACFAVLGAFWFIAAKTTSQQQSIQLNAIDFERQLEALSSQQTLLENQLNSVQYIKEYSSERMVGVYSEGKQKDDISLILDGTGGFSLNFYDAMEDNQFTLARGLWRYSASGRTLSLFPISIKTPCFDESRVGLPCERMPTLTFVVQDNQLVLIDLETGVWSNKSIVLYKN